jgi:hypothetical protein
MLYKITTKYGSYDIEADREPTQSEAEQIAYSYSKTKPGQQEVDQGGGEDSSLAMQGLYIALDTIPALTGAWIGKKIGAQKTVASAFGAAGNLAKQTLQKYMGDREEISGGEAAGAAIYSIPVNLNSARKFSSKIGNVILRNAVTSSAEGALIATAASSVQSAIENGGLPDIVDVSLAAGFGTVLGGAAGGTLSKYARDGKLINNNAVAISARSLASAGSGYYTYENLKEQGDPNALTKAIAAAGLVYGATKIPSKIASSRPGAIKGAVLGPEFVVGKETSGAIRSADEQLSGRSTQGSIYATEIEKLISKYQNKDEIAALVFRAAETDNLDIAPAEFRPYLEAYRAERVSNSNKIIELYPNLNPKQVEKIQNQAATYQRRSYRAFERDSVSGVDYNRPNDRAAFKKELIDGMKMDEPNLSDGEYSNKAEAYMARMINDGNFLTSGGLEDVMSQSSKASSSLKKRGEISESARKFLGEVTSPGPVLMETLDAQSRLIVTGERDKVIIKSLLDAKLASASKTDTHTILFNRPEKSMLHPAFDDMWTTPEVSSALSEMLSPHLLGSNSILGGWLQMSGISKATKTVLNPLESIVPQIYGNLAIAASAFKASPKYLVEAARKISSTQFGKIPKSSTATEKIAMAKELRKLISLGISQNSYDTQEIKTLLNLASKETGWKGVIQKFSKVYSTPDAVFRYAIWKSNIDELVSFEKAFKKGSIPDDAMALIEKKAADITNDQFPTYNRVLRRYRQASAVGAANAFGAFEFEVIRNSANQIKYARQLVQEGMRDRNSAKTIAGLKRFIGFGAVAGTTVGLGTMASRMMGVGSDDASAMDQLSLPYDKDSAKMYGATDDGKIFSAQLNYLMPFSNMMGAVTETFTGGNPLPIIKNSLLGSDIGPLLTPAFETINNTYYGTNVPIELPKNYGSLLLRQIVQSFMPGSISGTLNRARKATVGLTNNLGQTYNWPDVFKRLGGIRGNTYDPIKLATVKIKDDYQRGADAQAGYRRVLNQMASSGASGFDDSVLYAKSNREFLESQTRLAQSYAALKQLQNSSTGKFKSITDEAIYDAFDSAGVPKRVFLGVSTNSSIPMNRGLSQTNSDFFEVASKLSGTELKNVLKQRSLATGSPVYKIKSDLRDYVKFEKQVKGNNSIRISALFKNMGVQDGERALHIFYVLNGKDAKTRESLMRELRRQNLLPYEVTSQLRKLERSGSVR